MYHSLDLPHILDKSTKIFLRGESGVENKSPWERPLVSALPVVFKEQSQKEFLKLQPCAKGRERVKGSESQREGRDICQSKTAA